MLASARLNDSRCWCAASLLQIFPEGTTVNARHVIQFQKGAFIPGVPVQPITLEYPYCFLDTSMPPDVPNHFIMLRMFCQVYNRLEVTFMPVHVRRRPPLDSALTRTWLLSGACGDVLLSLSLVVSCRFRLLPRRQMPACSRMLCARTCASH